jgi:hypothetical protein
VLLCSSHVFFVDGTGEQFGAGVVAEVAIVGSGEFAVLIAGAAIVMRAANSLGHNCQL